MTIGRFLAIIPAAPDGAGLERLHVRRLSAGRLDLGLVIDTPRLQLLAGVNTGVLAFDDQAGAVLGSLFRRGCEERLLRLDRRIQLDIVASRGAALIDRFWGNYIAVLCADAQPAVAIVRAPLGALPCLVHHNEMRTLLGSDLDMLALGGWRPAGIEWTQMALHLAARDVPRRETCLEDICELRGGDRLTAERGRISVEPLWSPWEHTSREQWIADPAAAAAQTRDAVTAAVRSSVSAASHPLLMLSGGLDSSVVAACLAERERPFTCLNLVSDDPSGDERRYARQAAAATGAKLVEAVRQVANVDVTRSAAAGMPRPSARSFVQDSDRIAADTANAVGADLVVDGGGGDNVFCSLQSAAPVADAILGSRSAVQAWRTAREIALMAKAGLPIVFWRGVRRAWRPVAYRWPVDLTFLPPGVAGDPCIATGHPWLEPPAGALPGTAAHVALIVAAQGWAEGFDPRGWPPPASPLVSQPVVEACLRVPSWLWFRGGRNRAVVRTAFADSLPAAIVDRCSKASPDSFVADLFERNRPILRALLLDGRLAGHRLLDRQAIETILADPRPAYGQHYRRIMRLADAEAWASSWS